MSAGEATGVILAIAAYAFFAVLSVVLGVVDARTHRLPDRYVLPAYPIAGVLLVAAALLTGTADRLFAVGGGGLGMFGFYLMLRMLRPGAMGGGDVKLAGVAGGYLGFLGWDTVLMGAFAGFLLGGVYALLLLATRRAHARTAIAFGPFLLGGAWFAIAAAGLPLLAG